MKFMITWKYTDTVSLLIFNKANVASALRGEMRCGTIIHGCKVEGQVPRRIMLSPTLIKHTVARQLEMSYQLKCNSRGHMCIAKLFKQAFFHTYKEFFFVGGMNDRLKYMMV